MRKHGDAMLEERLSRLEEHLQDENPVLAEAVQGFRHLDRIAYRLGLLRPDQSYAARVSWWPVIAVVGTFSSGKSTFINRYVGAKLQATGNQAVDDRFTVICYGHEPEPRVLPGLALDSDPRFPFYRMSINVEEVAAGEGRRLNSYLQMKAVRSDSLRGKIIIDSPGFDADAQRTSTLHIVDHIMDLSDLVLVFFDARHPEPGAMHDTLQHLVAGTINRPDANKFLYILNQIDTTAREDNPEEVFGAWQRAIAQHGLTAGRFFRIYDPDAAVMIENPERRRRFEAKRHEDVTEIETRMHQVEVERAYGVIGTLRKQAAQMRDELVPAVRSAKRLWKKRVWLTDAVVFGTLIALAGLWAIATGYWDRTDISLPTEGWPPVAAVALLVVIVIAAVYLHQLLRRLAARTVVRSLRKQHAGESGERIVRAFEHSARPWRLAWSDNPAGWGRRSRKALDQVLADADRLVQRLNDRFTSPSGRATPHAGGGTAGVTVDVDERVPHDPAPDVSPEPTRDQPTEQDAEPSQRRAGH